MARPKGRKPNYCCHKPSNRAYVAIDGKPIYLGVYNSPESKDKYDQVIGEWIARGRQSAPALKQSDPSGGTTVAEVCAAYWNAVKDDYTTHDGKPAGVLDKIKTAIRYVNRLYGPEPVKKFGPVALKTVRAEMLKPHKVRRMKFVSQADGTRKKMEVEVDAPGWCRTGANKQTRRIRAMFQWAAESEMIDAGIYHALLTVKGLRTGRGGGRETTPVTSARQADIDAVLKVVSPTLRAMIELEAISAMRPGEVRNMKTREIDRTDKKIWVYRPAHHKMKHAGLSREIRLGPKAQQLITPFLRMNQDAYIFSPKDSDAWHRDQKRAARKTLPISPSQLKREAEAKHRQMGDCYSKDSYARAIARACRKAGLGGRFTPNQLRHAAATRLRKQFGIEATQAILGHKNLATTQIYAEADVAQAERVMGEVG